MARDIAQAHGLGVTGRVDAWWVVPLVTALGFGGFIVYTTFRAFHGYYTDTYHIDVATSAYLLSPFYSPLIIFPSMPWWVSPTFFILWAPGGLRVTCYYYRKFYYRAYFLDPPACAVGEARGTGYKGETRLFLLQNLHRYFLYAALFVIAVLTYDVFLAMIWPVEGGGKTFGLSLATVIMGLNVAFLSAYTFGCHSLRHLLGGNIDCFTCVRFGGSRHAAWKGVSKLNEHHMFWAWVSMISVGFTDFYIWMLASGRFTDIRFF